MWALHVLAGHVPYRDFVVGTAPMLAYVYGAVFGLAGHSLLVDRVMGGLPMLLGTVLLAVIAHRLLPGIWSAAVALLWGVWLPAFVGYGAYHFWGPPFVLGMVLALLSRRPRPYLAGVLASLALLSYQALLPAVAGGLLVAFLARRRWTDAAAMAVPLLVTGLVLGAYLLIYGTFAAFIDQTIVFTTGQYQNFNRQPYPLTPLLLGDTLNWHSGIAAYWEFPMFWLLGVVAPVVIIGYAAYRLLGQLRRPAPEVGVPAALAFVSTGLFASAFIAHLSGPLIWLAAPLALVLVAYRIRALTATPSRALQLAALAPVLLLWVGGLSPGPVGWWLNCTINPNGPLLGSATVAGTVCLRRPEAAELQLVERAAASAQGSGIAFLPTSPGLYQLTGTTPEIPSVWTLPRHTRASEIQRTETAMLRSVIYVVYVADPELDTGHPWQFDDFLATNYTLIKSDPGVLVYRRK
jgi:hypothetical protein